jgi:plastocyanin
VTQAGGTQGASVTGPGVSGAGVTSAGDSGASGGGVTSAEAGVSSGNGSGAEAAGNQAAAGNGAANGGSPQFVSDLDGCNGLTVDATIRADEAGNFDPPDLEIQAGSIVRFAPIGGSGMRALGGDFQTQAGDTTCIVFNRRGVYSFDGSTVPTRLTVRVH